MKKIFIALMAVMALAGAAQAFSLNVDPPSLWITVAPNSSKTGNIVVDNKGDDPISVKSYTEDWVYAKDRTKVFKKPGSTANSCSNWISLFPNSFTINPGESQQVKYTITAPPAAMGGYYSVIFFESSVDEPAVENRSNVKVVGRIGTIVYLETEGAKKAATIQSFTVDRENEDKPIYFNVLIRNEGETILRPTANVIVTDASSKLYARLDLKCPYILPKETIPLKGSWTPKLDEGDYDTIATVDYGGPAPLIAQQAYQVFKATRIESLSLIKGEPNIVMFSFSNKRNSAVKARPAVEVRDTAGRVIASVSAKEVKVPAMSTKEFQLKFKGALYKGLYSVRATVNVNRIPYSKIQDFAVE